MIKNFRPIFILFASISLVACASKPTHDREAEKRYTQGITARSFAVSSSWQTKSCPDAKSKSWQSEDWKTLLKIANGCVVKKDWTTLEDVANHLAKRDHQGPWGAYFLSLAAQSKGSHSRALWMIDLALKKAPGSGLLVYQKGRLLWDIEEYGQATETFEQALELDPSLLDAHMMLGQIYYRDQEFNKAKGHFAEVLKNDDDNYVALVGMAECELKDNNANEALNYFSLAIRENKTDLALRVRKAFVLEQNVGDSALALKEYQDIQQLLSKGKINGQLSFNINDKIKDLEVLVSKIALSKEEGRSPGSQKEVAK